MTLLTIPLESGMTSSITSIDHSLSCFKRTTSPTSKFCFFSFHICLNWSWHRNSFSVLSKTSVLFWTLHPCLLKVSGLPETSYGQKFTLHPTLRMLADTNGDGLFTPLILVTVNRPEFNIVSHSAIRVCNYSVPTLLPWLLSTSPTSKLCFSSLYICLNWSWQKNVFPSCPKLLFCAGLFFTPAYWKYLTFQKFQRVRYLPSTTWQECWEVPVELDYSHYWLWKLLIDKNSKLPHTLPLTVKQTSKHFSCRANLSFPNTIKMAYTWWILQDYPIYIAWLCEKQNSFPTKLKLINFKLKCSSKAIFRERVLIKEFELVSSRGRFFNFFVAPSVIPFT